uniref:Organic cation transporter protein n=1 Tax=Araneus ventricosus TaxID=182803 RepID=A0A4Y2RT11_ARAVE|nr:Organic cation transporter protein [Araneus ventricosus]
MKFSEFSLKYGVVGRPLVCPDVIGADAEGSSNSVFGFRAICSNIYNVLSWLYLLLRLPMRFGSVAEGLKDEGTSLMPSSQNDDSNSHTQFKLWFNILQQTRFCKERMGWDLVCDREWLVSMAKTIYMLGFLFGSIINGQLSDRFGRRKVMILCLCVFLVFAFLTLLSTNIIMFLIFRFFLAFGLTSVYVNSAVVLAEITSAEYRSIYIFAYKFGYVLGYPLTPLIAWLVPDWFWLQLIFTLPWLSLLCAFWILPETPRWLLSHRKFNELEQVLLLAAKKNGKDMKQARIEISDFISYHSQKDFVEEEATVLDLLRPTMRKNTINIFFSWFINSYIYFALSWNTNDLAGDPYWNFFITGAVELPEVFVFIFLCRYIGNRLGLAIANVLSGICLIGMLDWPRRNKDNVLFPCPARSPDITPCDFFFWCFVKDKVYVPPLPRNLEDLRTRIGNAVNLVKPDMLKRGWEEIDYRLDIVRMTLGSHFIYL